MHKMLLNCYNYGSNPSITNNAGFISLHAPMLGNRSKRLVRKIIDHGVDINTTAKQNQTALMLASKKRNNQTASNSILVSEKGHVDAMNVLIGAGANTKIEL